MKKVIFDRKLTIRIDDETYNKLKEKTEELGITQSEYLRQVILKGKAVTKKCKEPPALKELPTLISHLSRIGNNINQIARNLNVAKKEGYLREQDYDLLLDELMQINNNLKGILSQLPPLKNRSLWGILVVNQLTLTSQGSWRTRIG